MPTTAYTFSEEGGGADKPTVVNIEESDEHSTLMVWKAGFLKYGLLCLHWAGHIFGVCWGLFVYGIVFGHLFEGASALSNKQYVSIPVFVVLIFCIATLESFAFSITVLKLQDLSAVSAKYPIANRVHQIIFGTAEYPISPKRLDNVLMGRQVLLIIFIFIVAQATSFPNITCWPFSSTPYPAWMTPWFQNIFLSSGILGSFVVVWSAQLSAVLIATRNPPIILNLPQMLVVPYLCLVIQKIGLTLPSDLVCRIFVLLSPTPVTLKPTTRSDNGERRQLEDGTP